MENSGVNVIYSFQAITGSFLYLHLAVLVFDKFSLCFMCFNFIRICDTDRIAYFKRLQ